MMNIMDENSDDELNCIDDININFAYQKQLLENLKNKYNVNITKPSTSSSSTSSQQSLSSKSSSIKRTDSSNSNASSDQQYMQGVKSNNNKISTKIANKNKPTKYENVTVIIDFELLKTYDQGILNELDSLEIKYELKNQLYSNLITWYYENDELDSAINTQCETALLILNWKDVIDYVSSNMLIKHIKSILEVLVGKKISLGLYGFENYFRYWKLQKQYDKQEKNCNKKYCDYKDSIKISRYELEYVLTELELRHSCCHQFLENTQELTQIISQYTKSIAQLPEKLEKHEKFKNLDFCMVKDARDCVLVDKNGNGSRRLWQQQLTAFDLVRLETAEAILSKYPTPSKLFQAYSNCSKAEGIKLLEDIPIRRAAGPLSTTRRVGPELSAKIYNFFNATDGNALI
ncbi:eme1 protein [Holotrichia oblita]|uniref:Eme1 protein n=1 Tax=Holotrichia oblita TaxID=644536 RepID=A0ACB9SYS3_HOLOL|nr:eme1 protein [Holotrichia oblita]